MKLSDILNEVFVLGNKRPKNNDHVIAFRQWIWVLNDDNFEDNLVDISKKLSLRKDSFDDLDDLVRDLSENAPDVVVGHIESGKLVLPDTNERQSTASSTLAKVLKALKLKSVVVNFFNYVTEEDDEIEDSREDFLTPLASKSFYHGTSSKSLDKIVRTGIRPGKKSNFLKITHPDKVFVTLKKEQAAFHSDNSARQQDGFPVILEIKIPDVNKLVLDFDIAIQLYGKDDDRVIELDFSDIAHEINYRDLTDKPEMKPFIKRQRSKSEDLNTKLGIFGYVGRIPASFIKSIHIDTEAFEQFFIRNELLGEPVDIGEFKIEPVSRWDELSALEYENLKADIEERFEEESEDDDS